MSKDTFYFSHDYNSRNDEKIKFLIRNHGLLGYGLFWAIIEDLYNNANALRMDYEGIAYDFRIDVSIVKSIINDFDLFVFEGNTFGSLSVQKRIDERDSKSVKARESAHKRWINANALQSQCASNAIKESKVKEIKEKKEMIVNIDFDFFWDYYDKRVGDKNKIKKKWDNLTDEEREKAFKFIESYKIVQPDKQFRKNPETFLNNKSWNDEIIKPAISTKLSYAELEWERLKNLG
jgi:uncharacterized protein YcfL